MPLGPGGRLGPRPGAGRCARPPPLPTRRHKCRPQHPDEQQQAPGVGPLPAGLVEPHRLGGQPRPPGQLAPPQAGGHAARPQPLGEERPRPPPQAPQAQDVPGVCRRGPGGAATPPHARQARERSLATRRRRGHDLLRPHALSRAAGAGGVIPNPRGLSRQDDRVALRPVVAADLVVDLRRAAEVARPDDRRRFGREAPLRVASPLPGRGFRPGAGPFPRRSPPPSPRSRHRLSAGRPSRRLTRPPRLPSAPHSLPATAPRGRA